MARIKRWWRVMDEPRTIMTYGTLCKLHTAFSYALLAMVLSFFAYSPSALDHPWFTGIRFGLMFFLFVMVIVFSIVRGSIELTKKHAELNDRMDVVLKKVDRLVKHAEKTGFNFDSDV